MHHEYRQSRTSLVVWPWPGARGPAPSPKRSWGRIALTTLVGLVVASVFWVTGHRTPAIVVGSIAVGLALIAVAAPRVSAGIETVFARFGRIVGTTLTWLLLVPFFYLVFPIGRVGFRLRGRDPLERAFSSDRPTYWQPRESYDDAEAHCRRQYS